MTTDTPTVAIITAKGDLLPCSRIVHNLSVTINRTIAHAMRRLESYATQLKADPFVAVQQHNPARYAAQIDVWRHVHDRITSLVEREMDDAEMLGNLLGFYLAMVTEGAGDIGHEQSSSPMTNLARREQLVAYVEVTRLIRSVI